uniref:Titin n=1 Tax=Hucho hucho TaxID=62062 RepID=A0A4W5MP54_9TELE
MESHIYEFRVLAENVSGVGEPSSPTVFYKALDPIFRPGAPVNPKVTDISKTSVFLSWGKPIYDGGCEIQGYIVEKCEVPSPASLTKQSIIVEPATKAPAAEGEEATAAKGAAEAAPAEAAPAEAAPTEPAPAEAAPAPADAVPQIPRKLSVVDQTKTSISLAWEKPEHDGGSRIIHYLLEIQPKGSEKWSGVATVRAMESVVNNLNPGEEYIFRVFAINDKGKSDPRELALPVTAKDLVIEPDVRPAFSNYSVRVGKDFKVEIPIAGRPKPAVKWTKDGSILLHTSRVKIANTPDSTTLSITEATGEDGGMYGINVTNVVGEKNATIEIIALDKPGPPSGPVKFDEVTINTATISWGPPKHSGGCQISNYIVQKRDTTTTTWENVAASVARTTLKVQRLKTGAEYQFRIIAQNRYGKSYGLDSHPLTIKYPYKEPANDEVKAPRYSIDPAFTKTIIINAGDTFKLDADVHGKPVPTIQWFKDDVEIEKNTMRLEIKNTESVSSAVIMKNPFVVPGAPHVNDVTNIARDSMTVCYSAPETDGGSDITTYIIEKKDRA